MKKILTLICTLLCANVLMAQTRFWVDSLCYETTNYGEVKVYSSHQNIVTANIPDTFYYDGIGVGGLFSVTEIGSAFFNRESLTSVTIPNSVTSIGEDAFYNCSSLTSVTIGNSVTSIGERAFYSCDGLTSITIPNSVTSIGVQAFNSCSSLTSVTIPNSVTEIGNYAFDYCSSLTSVTIPNSVTEIGTGAFQSCSSLTSVTIPNSVTEIGNYAFRYCSSLTSVTIGNSVTSIGSYAFGGCSSLTSVTCLAENPPAASLNTVFADTPNEKILFVPCSALNNYINNYSEWNSYYAFGNRITGIGEYNIVANVNNSTFGNVMIEHNCSNATATLTATANPCYEFVSWNDGNTQNPRTINLTSDTTFSAIFEEREIEYTINTTIVDGQVYNLNGFNESETGTYVQNLQDPNGCDSTVILNLTVVTCEPYYEERTVTYCAGERYIDMSIGINVTEGVYTLQISDLPGCDSTLVLTVVERGGDSTIFATINAGETYSENGFNESEAGTYVQNLQTVNGCDSTITLILDVNSSLMDVEHSEFSFFPNPTNSKVTFNQAIERIELIDLVGKTLRTYENESEINIESLPSGAYYLCLTNNDKAIMRKVIKE